MISGVAMAMVSATSAFAAVGVAQVADWTGFYVGAHVGSADMSGDYLAETGSCNPCRVLNLDGQSTAAGVQGGYNYQAGKYVFGVEGDISSVNIDETSGDVSVGGVKSTRPDFTRSVDWTATVAPRLGVVHGKALIYGKVGWAYGRMGVGHFTSGGGVYVSNSEVRDGWVAGAGVEYQFAPKLTARIEYDRLDFGDEVENFSSFDVSNEVVIDSVRLGVNYAF